MKCYCHHAYEMDSEKEQSKQADYDVKLEQLKIEVAQAEYDSKAQPL